MSSASDQYDCAVARVCGVTPALESYGSSGLTVVANTICHTQLSCQRLLCKLPVPMRLDRLPSFDVPAQWTMRPTSLPDSNLSRSHSFE